MGWGGRDDCGGLALEDAGRIADFTQLMRIAPFHLVRTKNCLQALPSVPSVGLEVEGWQRTSAQLRAIAPQRSVILQDTLGFVQRLLGSLQTIIPRDNLGKTDQSNVQFTLEETPVKGGRSVYKTK